MESEEPRYERKFVFRGSSLQEIQQFIRLHPAHFQVLYPDRYINNIYFDTFNFSRYREQLAGVSKRSKLRLRWYGDRFCRAPARFERKCREGFVNWKEIVEINDFQFKETGAL